MVLLNIQGCTDTAYIADTAYIVVLQQQEWQGFCNTHRKGCAMGGHALNGAGMILAIICI